jgi:hypothetical protein
VASSNIVIWDRQMVHLRLAGYTALAQKYGVRVQGSQEAGYDESAFLESPLIGNLIYSDLEFEKKGDKVGRKSFVTKLVTHDITKIINIPPLLNHNIAGVAGNLYSLASGTVDNFTRFEQSPENFPVAVADIYSMQEISDKVVLSITDALIAQYAGGQRSLLHYSSTPNELRFSRDPVALDALSLTTLETLRDPAQVQPGPGPWAVYKTAAFIELGVADVKKIRVERLEEEIEKAGSHPPSR